MKVWILALAGTTACAAVAETSMVTSLITLATPAGHAKNGDGSPSDASAARIAARGHAALAEATRGALDAAAARPADLRLQRRAAAMVRRACGDADAKAMIVDLDQRAASSLQHLVETEPCPGLVDAAATWVALGNSARGGESYARAAHDCSNLEAAVAAVHPLKESGRCDVAIATVRGAWPQLHGRAQLGIELLDGVRACSDAITLRRNLDFVPPDIVEDYFRLLEARRLQAIENERRADAERREREAESRALAASSHCESECSAAVSSCSTSCNGIASCIQSCDAVGHACRSGCGGY